MPYHRVRDPAKLHALLDAVLLVESDLDRVVLIERMVRAAVELAGARYGALGVLAPGGEGLSEFVHYGMDPATVARIGSLPKGMGLLGLLVRRPEAIRIADLATHPESVGFPPGHPPMSSFLGAPVRVRGQVFGILYLTDKRDGGEFSDEDQQLVTALAVAAGGAVENARLQERIRQLTLAEDRERIARDLHDTVIQRIFAVALSLQAAEGAAAADPALAERLRGATDDLDETIRQIRTTIFALEPPAAAAAVLRAQVIAVCAEARRSLGFDPAVRLDGPVDAVPAHVGGDVLAALREALSNVARHAGASHVAVSLTAADVALTLAVADDGVGYRAGGTAAKTGGSGGSGIPNMVSRAEALGGSCDLCARPGGGTHLEWRVPLAGSP